MLEAQERVGGRTLTARLDGEGAVVDDGGQWVSPGQDRIVGLAAELGVELFESWDAGDMVLWRDGRREVADGLFLPADGDAAAQAQQAAKALAAMAASVPVQAPWSTPDADAWDRLRLHDWLADNVASPRARIALATAIEGVFARNATSTSLLAALYWAHCGDPLVPFTATDDPGPERRFVGGAQRSPRGSPTRSATASSAGRPSRWWSSATAALRVTAPEVSVTARRAIVSLPPALAVRLRYAPGLPAARDHLLQRTPMRWVIKVHCVYPERFWADDGLSGAVAADDGLPREELGRGPQLPRGRRRLLVPAGLDDLRPRDPRAPRARPLGRNRDLRGVEREDGGRPALGRASGGRDPRAPALSAAARRVRPTRADYPSLPRRSSSVG